MSRTKEIQNLSFTVNDTFFSAKLTRYSLNEDKPTQKPVMEYLLAVRLVQDNKVTFTHIEKYESIVNGLKAYKDALKSMARTHYNIVISELQRIDIDFAKIRMDAISLEGFEGNLKQNLEVAQEIIDAHV